MSHEQESGKEETVTGAAEREIRDVTPFFQCLDQDLRVPVTGETERWVRDFP